MRRAREKGKPEIHEIVVYWLHIHVDVNCERRTTIGRKSF